MRENRLHAERIAAVVRLALAFCAAAVFVTCRFRTGVFHHDFLEYLFLAFMGLALLYSSVVAFYLKRRGYRRFLSFVSSSIDVSAISLAILVTGCSQVSWLACST